ncbi:D-alanine--D-alanine ligase [Lactococcus formosensis]|uniref:D-alanine--D-alanine ligase n=1 Tax=Lactococcus formosensis TaxID=1281486 RepID=UPI0007CBA022|nr:D-alanine--D-alanine ligase [Lactococcus formosensis]BAV02501.1 D-alanine--D-alanine ligase [Lactococcus formosensis]BDW48565.1 D-alanine--D-alanine ligase [Lactococcus formosensis]BDX24150.1 D-alanine--D-alanine ligase [Lactococcus formosensis]
MSKETLILLYGGRSAEREVSVLSAESVMRAVNYDKFRVKTYFISQTGDFIKTQEFTETPAENEKLMTNETVKPEQKVAPSDIYEKDAVVFPVLHGPMGEDGSIQGFLEIMRLAYVGPNILSASSTMDKLLAKHVFSAVGVPQVPYVTAYADENQEKIHAEVHEKLTFPVFVKPANMGSSVGISKVNRLEELEAGLAEAYKYDNRVVIEQGVDAREIECAVLGNGGKVRSTLPGEVVKDVDFYDYRSKYIDNKIEMAIPADIPAEVAHKMRNYAEKAYQAMNGAGLSRCDFFYDQKGDIYLNEINAIPGFTQWSMYPLLWENMGLSYSELIEELVHLAQEAFEIRESHLL